MEPNEELVVKDVGVFRGQFNQNYDRLHDILVELEESKDFSDNVPQERGEKIAHLVKEVTGIGKVFADQFRRLFLSHGFDDDAIAENGPFYSDMLRAFICIQELFNKQKVLIPNEAQQMLGSIIQQIQAASDIIKESLF